MPGTITETPVGQDGSNIKIHTTYNGLVVDLYTGNSFARSIVAYVMAVADTINASIVGFLTTSSSPTLTGNWTFANFTNFNAGVFINSGMDADSISVVNLTVTGDCNVVNLQASGDATAQNFNGDGFNGSTGTFGQVIADEVNAGTMTVGGQGVVTASLNTEWPAGFGDSSDLPGQLGFTLNYGSVDTIPKANGSGGFVSAIRNTDYAGISIVTGSSPTTGQTVSATTLKYNELCYIDPAGTLLALTFSLPSAANAFVGQVISGFITQIITTLTVNTSGGGTIKGSTPVTSAINSSFAYECVSVGGAGIWVRIY
jgi:hypothetical protein